MDASTTDAGAFERMSDDELKAAALDPNLPARLIQPLKAEIRRRSSLKPAYTPHTYSATAPAPHVPGAGVLRVVVTDVDISFGQMVSLLVKFYIAMIPAFLILGLIGLVFYIAVLAVVAR